MAPSLNHTIVWCRDKYLSAPYLAEILGLDWRTSFGPFLTVEAGNGGSLDFHDFYEPGGDFTTQLYAFSVEESEFDEIFERSSIERPDALGGPWAVSQWRDQSQRWWERRLFPGPR